MSNNSVTTANLDELTKETGNLYKSIAIISKRARQIAARRRQELDEKLVNFSISSEDNLEEQFENKERTEISRYYEQLPKPSLVAIEEFFEGKIYYSDENLDETDENLDESVSQLD